ncbi:hypothetical protein PTB13_18090, partial [Bacillus sp. MHSD17]|nr:hypothetical protein [Bacillus sp. MHSD17]
GLRKTNVRSNSLAHGTTWLRSDLTVNVNTATKAKIKANSTISINTFSLPSLTSSHYIRNLHKFRCH